MFLTAQQGCAGFSLDKVFPSKEPQHIGRVGIASVAYEPEVGAYGLSRPGGGPRNEVIGGALAGGAGGAGIGAAACTPSVIIPWAYAACIATAGMLGLLVGGVAGSAVANTKDTKALQPVLPPGRVMREALHNRVVDLAVAQNRYSVVDLGTFEPATSEKTMQSTSLLGKQDRVPSASNYRQFTTQGVEHVLETTILAVNIHGAGAGKYRLHMECQSRLINIAGGEVLIGTHRYRGPEFSLAEDAEDDQTIKRQVIEAGIESIAREIISKYFPQSAAATVVGV
jgi:hypothetical protein